MFRHLSLGEERIMAKRETYSRRQVIGTIAAAVATTAAAEGTATAFGPGSSPQVQAARVTRYSFGWNTRGKNGILYLYLENGSTPATINVSSPDEFAGYLTILKEPQAFFDSNGWIYTGTQNPRL
jgi:hypothetical protein